MLLLLFWRVAVLLLLLLLLLHLGISTTSITAAGQPRISKAATATAAFTGVYQCTILLTSKRSAVGSECEILLQSQRWQVHAHPLTIIFKKLPFFKTFIYFFDAKWSSRSMRLLMWNFKSIGSAISNTIRIPHVQKVLKFISPLLPGCQGKKIQTGLKISWSARKIPFLWFQNNKSNWKLFISRSCRCWNLGLYAEILSSF